MQRDQLIELVDAGSAATAATTDRGTVLTAIGALARLIAWCESQQIACSAALDSMGSFPEAVLAQTSRSNARDAERIVERARTAQAAPVFADALAVGKVAGGHLDQFSNSLRRLDSAQRATLLADAPRLVAIAAQSTPDEFARTLRAEERRLATDDGMARLERQRAAVRLHRRVDMVSGMHHFNLTLDPYSGLLLHNKIHAATEAMFHDTAPEGCPSDPIEKQSFLRAHALLSLIEGKGMRLGRPEIVVVVEAATAGSGEAPIVDWGLPVELPDSVLHDLFEVASVHPIVVRNGAVLHAPGRLDLGRTTRLANSAQRRALRALYPTCAIPECRHRFDLCKLHHIHWWRDGGHTDLHNLLPLCSRHHTAVHQSGWGLHLADDRTLTITLPDQTTMITGPPQRRAA